MLLPDDIDAPPFTDEDLEAYFEWEDDPGAEEPDNEPSTVQRVAAWSVCDTSTAEWAMRRSARARQEVDEVNGNAELFIAQIERWREEQLRQPERALNFFAGQLVTYARRKREEDGLKTLKLPSGAVTSRLNPARPDIPKDAKEAFIEWAKARELPVVKATWAPVMDEVKKHVVFRTVIFPKASVPAEQVYAVGSHLMVAPHWEQNAEVMLGGLDDSSIPVLTDPETGAFEERPSTAIYRRDDGSWWLVPGVVEVPAEVTYSVKPSLP